MHPSEFLHFQKKYVRAEWTKELSVSQLRLCDKEFVTKDYIMYCDKFRRKTELADAVRTAFQRVNNLGSQEIEEFENWVRNILLSVCENKRSVVKEILEWARNGDENMAFKYNIVRMFEEERAEG